MDMSKKHLARLSDNSLVVLDEGVSAPEGSTVLGIMSRNIDGSFEDGLDFIDDESGKRFFYRSFQKARDARLVKIRTGRDCSLLANDKAYIIALKENNQSAITTILAERQILLDAPAVAQSELALLNDLESINTYHMDNIC